MAGTYVQVQPDSTGKKIQVFENTLDGTNAVEAQAQVQVDPNGFPMGEPFNPVYHVSPVLVELLQSILAELRVLNMSYRETNPRILRDEARDLEADPTFLAAEVSNT